MCPYVHCACTAYRPGVLSMCANFSTKLQGLLSQWQGLMVADLPPLCFVPESRVRSR